jgi:tetratricopeptide (TPR) repeat protein
MSTVYHAHDLRHDRPVALKVLRPELALALGAERFLREIRLTARLDHPGILPLLDSGEAGDLLYYVMPLVEGESLRDRLIREKQLPVEDALRIAAEVGDALSYAHEHGVVHRDIKPENILLSAGHARVADFGIARAVVAAGGESLTATGIAVGTLAYMSPEQAAADDDVDGRSDLYSLGCVLYEMLSGSRPFAGTSAQALLARKSLETPAALRLIRPTIPEAVERAVLKALAPLPADRFATTADFTRRITTRASGASMARGRARRRPLIISAAVVAVAAIPVGTWIGRTLAAPPPPEIIATRIAVFPFVVKDAALADLSQGLQIYLSNQIDGIGQIRRVDPNLIMGRLQDDEVTEVTDIRMARRIARDLGAGRYVLGRVVRSGHRVSMYASLYREDSLAGPEQHFAYDTHVDSTSALYKGLARDLLRHLPTGAGTWPDLDDVEHLPDVEALLSYSRGETRMRESDQNGAADEFRAALKVDSTFALAWLRLAFAEEYRMNEDSSIAAIERALRHSDRLTSRERMLAEAVRAYYHGDGDAAERAAQKLTNVYSHYGEAWYQRAAPQFWYGWQRGRSPMRAKAALDKALAADPEHRPSMHLKSVIATYEGDLAHAESLQLRGWGNLWSLPPQEGPKFRAFLDSGRGFWESKAALLTYVTAGYTDRLLEARDIARILVDPESRPPETRSLGYLLSGLIEAAGGRWNAASSAMTEANGAAPGVGVLERGWIAALPFLGVTDTQRHALRDSLAAWRIPDSYAELPRSRELGRFREIGLLFMPPWLVPHARRYVLGLLSVSLGDEPAADRYARLLATAREPRDTIGLLADLSREVRATQLMRRGDTTEALAVLERTGFRVASRAQMYESMFHTRPLARFIRAEALAALGREEEALGWYEGLPWIDPAFVLTAWTSLRRGEIHERRGEQARAAHYYGRFTARWAHADARHQPLVKEIRERARRLHGAAAR